MVHEYVQYGCGLCAPETWLNFDCSPTLRFERLPFVGRLYTKNAERFPDNVRYGDIVNGLPIPEASCRAVYCSHVLEHLALDEFHLALQHTFQYLKPGGVFRFVLPDLETLARSYLADSRSSAASCFMESACLGKKRRIRGLRGFLIEWLGSSAHLWMWDEKAMTEQLRQHGFRDIRRAAIVDADDRRFEAVEDRGRFENCLAMQCRR
jgi:SAM-dependent methyltransferase